MKYTWEVTGKTKEDFMADPVDGVNGSRRWLLGIIEDGESVLDIGCGPGNLYEFFKRNNKPVEYLGIDIDPNYLRLAEIFYPGIPTRHTDAHFLPFHNNSIDHAIFFSVLEMLPDFRKAVDEAIRVAKKQIIIAIHKNTSLIDEKDSNALALTYPAEYLTRINRKKFTDYIHSFGYPVTTGTLDYKKEPQYEWFVIKKNK